MSWPSLLPAKLALLLNIPFSFHTIFYLAHRNGLMERLGKVRIVGKHRLPGTSLPLRQYYTGLGPLDQQLTWLVAFFAEAIDGSRPASTIQAAHFAGTFGAAGVLLMLEGARRGNAGKAVTWTTLAGNLAQNISFAMTAPSYCLLHLLTTTSTSAKPTSAGVDVPAQSAATLPLAMLLGYIVPSIILILPAPTVLSYDAHQIACAAWQLFPMYVAMLQIILQPIVSQLFPSLRSTTPSKAPLRGAYALGLSLAALSHTATLTLTITHTYFPMLFHKSFPTLRTVFMPPVFWPSHTQRVRSVGAGAHMLLQWDEICGSLAVFTWAGALLWGGLKATQRHTWSHLASAAIAVFFGVLLLGPGGTAVAMVWARDEMLVAADSQGDDRKTK